MTDEAKTDSVVSEEEESAVEPEKTEYLEFLGTDPSGHGTEFYTHQEAGTHTVSRAHMKATHDVELGVKEAVWKRGSNGRFLVPTADLNPAAVEILAADPMFKLVEL